jgi:hypothetical protein
MRFGTTANLNRLHADDKRITIGPTVIEPSSVVCDLGIYFDDKLSMREHVARTAQHIYASTTCKVCAPFDDQSAAMSQHNSCRRSF